MTQQAITQKSLVHKNENKLFWIVVFISIITYLLFALSIVGLFILGFFLLASGLLHALMIGHIRLNGVKIGASQFPLIHNSVEELCNKMEIAKIPDIYVIQSGGILNAFATRFFGRNMVVVYSEIFELIEKNAEDEVNFVIAHELAHIKRNHLGKLMFISPAMWIPGVAESYLRACEYTCDRYAAFYTDNYSAAKNSLTILAIGQRLSSKVNRAQYLDQINYEKGVFVWLAEALSTHPPLPKRINEISAFFGETEQIFIQEKKSKTAILIISASFLTITLLGAGSYYAFKFFDLAAFLSEEDEWEEEEFEDSPIFAAVVNGDLQEVRALIKGGEDIHTSDYNGYTPLDWAVMDENTEMVKLLLELKADPNYETEYGMTPFMVAAEGRHSSMIPLLHQSGGDPNYQESNSGYTALTYAALSGDTETVKLLLELNADRTIKDYYGMTPRMHALQSGEQEIADLLK